MHTRRLPSAAWFEFNAQKAKLPVWSSNGSHRGAALVAALISSFVFNFARSHDVVYESERTDSQSKSRDCDRGVTTPS